LMATTLRAAGLSPDRLAGIYLVGGSSRLPLVGTMIAEKLGVVPSSLDQPETAVALGAHHVGRDGISMRTQGVAGGIVSSGGPVPGGYAATAPPSPYRPQPAFGAPSNFPSVPVAKPPARSRKKPLVSIAFVVVALLVAGAVYLFWPSSSSATTYSAAQCAQPGPTDAKGFTGCLRQLARTVANGECARGAGSGDIAPPAGENLGVLVTCSAPALAGAQVTYLHGVSPATLKEYTDRLLSVVGGDQVRAEWKGNGLTGSYSSAAGTTSAVLVFTVSDRPLAGVIYQKAGSGQAPLTAARLADYFEQTVQPGE
jgi:Hsp70 protein